MPTWLVLILKIILVLIITSYPIVISWPNNWFTSIPVFARIAIVVFGMSATGIYTYWQEVERVKELRREVAKAKQELDLEKRKFAEYYIRQELRNLIEELKIPGNVRAYIYLKDSKTGNLKVFYEHGMEGMPDYELEFETDHGWAWEAWNSRDHVWCDLLKLGRGKIIRKWKFTSGQFRVIFAAGVRSVLFTPITKPNDPDIVFAVLGIDSNRRIMETSFNDRIVQERVYQRAYLLGQVMVNSGLGESIH